MPKHHKHRHHGWIVNNEKTMPIEQAAQLMTALAAKVEAGGHFKLNDVAVKLPPECHFVMRYERRPKGELVLKTELVWFPQGDAMGSVEDAFAISDVD